VNRLRSPWLLVAAALAAAPAAADWLVMKDGGRIETKGSWKVEGRRVLFTQPNGTLSVLKLDEVDLDQSAAVTAAEVEAARKAAEPEPEAPARRAPVLRLTEKDIPPSPEAGGEEGAPAAAAGAEAAPASDLAVASWEKVQNASADGIEIFGTIRNSGTNNITSPSVMVMIYGQDGGLLATNEGTINSGMIAPGQSANFRVAFPGVPDFASVKFDVQGRGFRARPGEAEEGSETEEEAPAPEAEAPAEGGA
jgi:hypothetical protein